MKRDKSHETGQPAVVYVTEGQLNAHIIKSKLESEGIPAMLQYESAGLIYGLTIDGMGMVKVLVPLSCVEEAKKILEGISI